MGKRAVIYLRVSTDEQAESGYSLPTQLAGCREYARKNGFTVKAELSDDCSGTIPIADRPKGRELYELCGNHTVDAVIIFTHDRTARDERVLEYLLFKSFLHDRKIELHFTDSGLDDFSMQSNLLGYIKAHSAAEERQKIRERTIRGKRGKASANHYLAAGLAPYGYRHIRINGHLTLEVDEIESKIAVLIFHLYVYGDDTGKRLSFYAIAERLTKMGVASPSVTRGNHFKKSEPNHWPLAS